MKNLCFYSLSGSVPWKSIKQVADEIFREIEEHILHLNLSLKYNTSEGKFFYGSIQGIISLKFVETPI